MPNLAVRISNRIFNRRHRCLIRHFIAVTCVFGIFHCVIHPNHLPRISVIRTRDQRMRVQKWKTPRNGSEQAERIIGLCDIPVNKYYLTWSLFLTLSGIPDIVLKIPYIFPKNETPNRMGGSYLPGSYQRQYQTSYLPWP